MRTMRTIALGVWLALSLLVNSSVRTEASFRQPASEDLLYSPDAIQRYAHTESGSYFGYSVAGYVGQSQSFCLVGAPRARYDSLADLGSSAHSDSERTGLVYRVDLNSETPDCSLVPIAITDEMRQEHGTPTPGISLWLGGSVSAASNTLNGIQLACDPRYVYSPDPINQSVPEPGTHTTREQGAAMEQPRNYVGTGQCALYTGASLQYTSVDACASQEEGACLAGFSTDVEAGGQFGEAWVALGMPGSYLTEGNVFLGHYRGRELINAMRLKSSPQDLKHMGFNVGYSVLLTRLIRDNMTVPGDFRSNGRGAPSLPGRRESISDRSLLTSSSMWVDNEYRGIVMIIDQAMDLGGVTYLKDRWSHIGSFFGYSLATSDLDGNGIAEVIVGAPYFTERKQPDKNKDADTSPTRPSSSNRVRNVDNDSSNVDDIVTMPDSADKKWGRLIPDVGRVYIFYGFRPNVSNNHLLGRDQTRPDYFAREPIVLSGLQSPSGRFGHAVVNLGDVDGDGTEDLAVGCPYCSDPEGRRDKGAVFVYLGRKHKMLQDMPFQIIWPGDLSRSTSITTTCGDFNADLHSNGRQFSSFGWSLSAGTDLDGNYAPDLLVGDFDSDQVVLLRARNTLWFDSPQWDLPLTPTLQWSGPNRRPCGVKCHFTANLSVVIHGNTAFLHQQSGHLKLHVFIDLDASMEHMVLKRLTGSNSIDPLDMSNSMIGIMDTIVPLSVERGVELGDTNRLTLMSLILEPQPIRVSSFLWKPVLINVTISPVVDTMHNVNGLKPVPSWTLHPFLGQRSFVSRPLYFANPACGPDNICHADLHVRMADLSEGPLDNLVIYFRERITQRNLTVGIGNSGENAYAARLRMTFPHQFSFSIPSGLVCQFKVLQEQQATQILCDLGDPLGFTGSNLRPIVFQLNTAGAFRDLDEPLSDEPAVPNGTTTEGPWTAMPGDDDDNQTPTRLTRHKKSVALRTDTVSITAEVISGNDDVDPRDNVATIQYKLLLAAKVELSSSSLDRTTIDSRNFTVQLYEMQRVHPETLGPEIKHVYLVSNNGPSPVTNLWVNVSMPVQTEDGEHLVYFLDRMRYQAEDAGPPIQANMAPEVTSAEGHVRGVCQTPEWSLNPLRLNAIHRGRFDTRTEGQQLTPADNMDTTSFNRKQRSVDVNYATTSETLHSGHLRTNNDSDETSLRRARSILPGVRRRQQEIIKCGEDFANFGKPICVTINCRIDQLSRGDAVRIVLRGYVWADTFFRHKIADLAIVSEARAELPARAFDIPVHGNRTIQPLAISQNFVFHGIKIPLFREIPLWPIVLGCVLGAVFLALIILGMWRCGFFRRKRWYDTNPTANSLSGAPMDF